MNIEEAKKITKSLVDTFYDAGDLALSIRARGLKKEIKSDNTPVTNGDIEVNKVLIKKIKANLSSDINLKLIDEYGINGDFIESQAFAFLAIRNVMSLPISFPKTTGCQKPSLGGVLIRS